MPSGRAQPRRAQPQHQCHARVRVYTWCCNMQLVMVRNSNDPCRLMGDEFSMHEMGSHQQRLPLNKTVRSSHSNKLVKGSHLTLSPCSEVCQNLCVCVNTPVSEDQTARTAEHCCWGACHMPALPHTNSMAAHSTAAAIIAAAMGSCCAAPLVLATPLCAVLVSVELPAKHSALMSDAVVGRATP